MLSPSTRGVDLLLKRERLQRAGVPHYWVVDPEVPRLLAWELRDSEYVTAADVSGDEAWAAPAPFSANLVPSELVR
ncbi:Uma2 family endonuclease [Aeromicrobium alkaliterrae]|uniref:Putative restriction endonuclease domain-containing protein n=1 Tax=Aeromicrobium alkaliterrae TaxID=302168 RepID=A0ABN2JLN3_9ACTN